MKDSREANLSKEVSIAFVAKVIMTLLGFFVNILFARILGPSNFGGLYIIFTVSALLLAFSNGIAQATNKRMSEVESNSGRIITGSLLIHLSLTPAILFSLFIFKQTIVDLSGVTEPVLPLILLFLFIGGFTILQRSIDATGRLGLSTWIDLARDIFRIPAQLVLIFLIGDTYGILIGLAIGTFLVFPIQLYMIDFKFEIPNRRDLESIMEYVIYSAPNSIVNVLNSELDIILLGILFSTTITGAYKTALLLTVPATFISGIISGGIQPRVSANKSEGKSYDSDIRNTIAFTSILSIPLFFGVLAIGKSVVITVYGGEYSNAAVFLSWLALYRIFQTQIGVNTSIINGLDHPDINLKISVFTLITILFSAYIFHDWLGPVGIAIAILTGGICKYCATIIFIRKYYTGPLIPKPILKQFVSGLLMFISISYISSVTGTGSYITVLVLVFTGVVIYSITLLIISNEIRSILFQNIKQISSSFI